MWLITPAWAHFLHLPIDAAVDVDGVAWASTRTDSDQQPAVLLRLDDEGFWQPDHLPAALVYVVSMVAHDGTLVLLDEGGTLWRRDGEDWLALATADVGDPVGAVSDGTALWVAGTAGVARFDGVLEVMDTAAASALAAAPGYVVWGGTDGLVHSSSGETLLSADAVTALATDGERTFAGHAESLEVWRDSTWTTCGALPVEDVAAPHATVVGRLWAGSDGSLMAGTGQDLFATRDECGSWARVLTDSGQTYDIEGSPNQASERWTAFTTTGGLRAYGWPGVWRLGETTARLEPIVGTSTAHGLAPGRDGLAVAMYGSGNAVWGSGVWRWLDPAPRTGRSVFPRANAADDDGEIAVTYDDGLIVWDGEAWTEPSIPLNHPRAVGYVGGRLWVSEWAGGDPVAAWSDDGATFVASDTLTAAVAGETIHGFAAAGGAFYALGGSMILRSADRGDTWEVVAEQRLTALAGDTRLIGVDDQGALTSDDAGETWTRRLETPGLNAVAVDGVAYAVDRGGTLWTSTDGEIWAAEGERFGGGAFALAVVDGAPLVATFAGVLDTTSGWLLPMSQRYGPKTGLATCLAPDGRECGTEWEGTDKVWLVPAGGSIALRSVGSSIELTAPDGLFSVADGGRTVGLVSPTAPLALDGPGWHDLVLTAATDTRVTWVVLSPELAERSFPSEDCGCSTTPPSPFWLLLPLLLRRRRA